MTATMNEPTRRITMKAGKELAAEMQANAAMVGFTPDKLAEVSPTVMILMAIVKKRAGGGRTAISRGDHVATFETEDTADEFRKTSKLKTYDGIRPGDLGGAPLGDAQAGFEVVDRFLNLGADLYGTQGPAETSGFLAWSFFRLLNTIREDCPGGTIGVLASNGDFIPVFGPGPTPSGKWGLHIPLEMARYFKKE